MNFRRLRFAAKKKIVFIVVSIDSIGGTEMAALRQANLLSRHFDVEIVSLFKVDGSQGSQGAVRIRYLVETDAARTPIYSDHRTERRMSFATDMALARLLHTLSADESVQAIVSMSPAFLRPIALFYNGNATIVHEEHRMTDLRGATRADILQFGYICDTIIVLAEKTKMVLERWLGQDAPSVVFMPNAVPQRTVRAAPSPPRIVVASRLVPTKQVHLALEAFAKIATDFPSSTLLVCGDGPERPRLEQAAGRLGVADRVSFLGFVEMDDVWPTASFGLLTSDHSSEAFPLVILEAMACGVPYLAFDCCHGVRTMVEDGKSGFIVEQDDVDALAAVMTRLLEDSGVLEEVSEGAFARVAEFSPARTTELLLSMMRTKPERSLDRKLDRIVQIAEAPPSYDKLRTIEGYRRLDRTNEEMAKAGFPVLRHRAARVGVCSPVDLRNSNLELVLRACRNIGVQAVVDPMVRWERPEVLVPRSRSRDLVEALADLTRGRPFYTEPIFGRGSTGPTEYVSDFEEDNHLRPVYGFRFYERVLNPSHSVVFGTALATRVRYSTESGGHLFAARGSQYTRVDTLPMTMTEFVDAAGLHLPTLKTWAEAAPRAPEVDAVFTWVDSTDAQWMRERASYAHDDEREDASQRRFRTFDELRYALRSVAAFMPWINQIYLVTNGQRPAWLTKSDRVQVVAHREIIPQRYLPTFNSHVIEANLHRLPTLSEHFIYFNDDFLLNRPAAVWDYFDSVGRPRVFGSGSLPSPEENVDVVWRNSRDNTYSEIEAAGYAPLRRQKYAHAPYALRKSILLEMWEKFETPLHATVARRFRSADDFVLVAAGFQEYASHVGKAERATIDTVYHALSERDVTALRRDLLESTCSTICIADTFLGDEPETSFAPVLTLLQEKFPIAAPWEAPDSSNH